MLTKNSLDKKLRNLEEKINPDSIEDNVLFDKLGQLIKESEEILGFETRPPLDPNKTYSQEELIKHYRRDY